MKDYNKELEFVQGSIKTKIWYQGGGKIDLYFDFLGKINSILLYKYSISKHIFKVFEFL